MNSDSGDGATAKRRGWFVLLATGVPTLCGALAVVGLLFYQQRLAWDSRTILRWQEPPIYLQEPGHKKTGHRYVFDEKLGWKNIPGWKATTMGKTLTINSQGFRGPELETPKARKRIVVLGDSFTWGYGVADEEVFPRVLAQQLSDANVDCEVVNTGVSGWGTDQEYLFLKQNGAELQPDCVVLAFFVANDIENNGYSVQYGLSKPVFENLTLTSPQRAKQPKRRRPRVIKTKASPVELTIALITAISQECQQLGCPLLVVKFGQFLYPEDAELRQAAKRIERALSELEQTRYLDLDEEFEGRRISRKALLVGNDDGHWNAYGHRMVAKILSEQLLSDELLENSIASGMAVAN